MNFWHEIKRNKIKKKYEWNDDNLWKEQRERTM